jgi:plasmid replication initiation protein
MSKNRQLDLFVALIGDVPFRDEREAMSAPLVALSKNKRTRIEWEGPSGQTGAGDCPRGIRGSDDLGL